MIFVDTSFLFALVSEKDAHHERVLAVAKDLLAVPLSEQLITTNHFRKYDDKQYSFVDCLSFVIMEKLGLKEALAVDSDFTHRFVAIPGPLQR